ncbi:hypothetical protein [Vreelandella titanicae]|uniref:hypothetical protein n=1 Tax=Vreelandella titanicae TaxID=664683 RepID=UPI001C975456|nr:hypothetical protein [Halomonas titanicae]
MKEDIKAYLRANFTWMAMSLVLAALLVLESCQPAHAQIPAAANGYQRELTRVVQQEWGMNGRVAVHAAQIHQESAWRSNVNSPVGAQGLSQFMPHLGMDCRDLPRSGARRAVLPHLGHARPGTLQPLALAAATQRR